MDYLVVEIGHDVLQAPPALSNNHVERDFHIIHIHKSCSCRCRARHGHVLGSEPFSSWNHEERKLSRCLLDEGKEVLGIHT